MLAEVPAGAGAGGGGSRPGRGDKEAEAHQQAQWLHKGSEESDGNAKKSSNVTNKYVPNFPKPNVKNKYMANFPKPNVIESVDPHLLRPLYRDYIFVLYVFIVHCNIHRQLGSFCFTLWRRAKRGWSVWR